MGRHGAMGGARVDSDRERERETLNFVKLLGVAGRSPVEPPPPPSNENETWFRTFRTFHEETGSILDTEGSDGLLHAYGPDLQLHSRLLYCVCLCTRLLQLCESKA